MSSEALLAEYKDRHTRILVPLAARVTDHLQDHLKGIARIDRISARAKSPDRFLQKALKTNEDGQAKYDFPFEQIQDLVGARVVVFYKQDVDVVSQVIDRYFNSIERRMLIPESESEFGYVGKHFVLALPEDVFDDSADRDRSPAFFELQVKTLFQHAWSEAGHDMAYKPEKPLTPLQKRQVALTVTCSAFSSQSFL